MKPATLLILGGLAALMVPRLAAQSVRPALNGRVSAEGKPLQGASIFIYTAGPKVGVGTL